MKSSTSICLLYRHLIAASGGSRIPQWQAQAARFTTTVASRSDDPTVAATTQTPDEPPPPETVVNKPELNKVRRVVQNDPRSTSKIKWSQSKPRKAQAKSSARADALFQQIIREQTARKDVPASTAKKSTSMDLALIQAIGNLEHMIEKGQSEAEAYTYLKTKIYPMLRDPDITIPQVFERVVYRLMEKVVSAKKEAIRSTKLPTVAEIFRVYADIGEMKPQRWAMLVGELVQSIVEMDPSTEAQGPVAGDGELATRDAMLADLVESWKILSLPRVVPATPDNEVIDGFWFPRFDKSSLKRFSQKGDFSAAFSSLFSHYHPNQLGAPVSVLAIATYALLLDPQRGNAEVRRNAARFVAKVAYLITFVHIRDTGLQSEVSNTFPRLRNYVMEQWPNIKEQLKERVEAMTGSTAHTESSGSSRSTGTGGISASSLGSQLSRAYKTGNIREVDRLWQRFMGSDKDIISPERAADLRKYPELFDSFVNVWMALNQPNQAIFALNTLRKVGLQPTLRTWNVMLDGCKKARNVNAIRNVWAKLAGSGIKLDTRIWTARVSGLIESGDVQGGIQALEEMTRLWNQSSKDENTTAVKPSAEPVNAALVGLIRQNQVSAAGQLLAWAGRQGIEPDIFTYNTLLRRFVRDGRDKDARRLFTMMKDTGVRVDEATFTILLDAGFSRIAPDDAEAQANTVASVLDEMQAAGLEANLKTYAKLIYNLLQLGDRARDALKVVLAHLWSHGHEFSSHIYTMIIEHWFARSPPDLDAVESLLQRRSLLGYDDTDRTFYDRVIKGYSLVGQTSKALDLYYKLSDAGVVLILSTQMELLRVLLQQGRLDDARGLVANTKRTFEESHQAQDSPESAGFWGHPFWRLAAENGVFERGESAAPAAGSGGASSEVEI
ncbi:hypothetical protein F4677DRAFT_417702 [Hypoxylon crocopeplum]|nr:hypothetical protein F4677DRAFT_417702 [Hypoxylon crocopeplum]